MIDKSRENEPGFLFAKLADTDNNNKWAREMQYFFKSADFGDHTLLENENGKPVSIIFRDNDLEDDAKLKRQQKLIDKIIIRIKNNVKYKNYISCICLGYIQEELYTLKTNWLAHTLEKIKREIYFSKRYK